MDRVEEGRTRWLAERPEFEAFAERVRGRLVELMRQRGIGCQVSARAKEVDSLVKKLITKPSHNYGTLPDRVGARVIVRFRSDLEGAVRAVCEAFDYAKAENKCDVMDDNQMGYLSHHVDLCCFRASDPDGVRFPPAIYQAEVQVRTKAQNLWAELSHDLVYKGPRRTKDLDRRVNLMAAQIEVADREFERLGQDLAKTLAGRATGVLERYYYRLTSRAPNDELTLVVLEQLLVDLGLGPDYVANGGPLDRFLSDKFLELSSAYDQVQDLRPSGMIHQPEALFLFERMSADLLALQRAWNERFPPEELERLIPFFGFSSE